MNSTGQEQGQEQGRWDTNRARWDRKWARWDWKWERWDRKWARWDRKWAPVAAVPCPGGAILEHLAAFPDLRDHPKKKWKWN